jgi:GTP cyclohydrolase I
MLFPWLCATFIRSNVTAPTQVIGLSKFNRIVHHICERPQIQEEMTTQIADALRAIVKTPHMCARFCV